MLSDVFSVRITSQTFGVRSRLLDRKVLLGRAQGGVDTFGAGDLSSPSSTMSVNYTGRDADEGSGVQVSLYYGSKYQLAQFGGHAVDGYTDLTGVEARVARARSSSPETLAITSSS